MKNLDIYAFGHALVDEEYAVSESFLKSLGVAKNHRTLIDFDRNKHIRAEASAQGELTQQSGGGSGANTLATAALLGAECHFSCLLGNDDEGHFYLQQLQESGIGTDENSIRDNGNTGVCLVMLTPDAARTMNTYVGITDFIGPNDINHEALQQADWIYIEGHLLIAEAGFQAASLAMYEARKYNKKVAVNFCDPAVARLCRDRLAVLLQNKVDILFCNEEEAAIWANCDDLELAYNKLDDLAHSWVVTLGEEGAVASDGQQRHKIAAHKVNAVSTLGAGDTFAGAFMYGLVSGMSYDQAGKLASLASATLVQQAGPRLSREQLQSLLETFRSDQ